MRSDVAIGIALSHSNVNSTGVDDGICILMELYLCQSLLFWQEILSCHAKRQHNWGFYLRLCQSR